MFLSRLLLTRRLRAVSRKLSQFTDVEALRSWLHKGIEDMMEQPDERIRNVTFHLDGEPCTSLRRFDALGLNVPEFAGKTICMHLELRSDRMMEIEAIRPSVRTVVKPVMLQITYRWAPHTNYGIDLSGFPVRRVECNGAMPVSFLPHRIKEQTITRLGLDKNADLRESILDAEPPTKLVFEVAVRLPGSDNRFVRADDGRLNVDILADLFENPVADNNRPKVLVTMRLDDCRRGLNTLDQHVSGSVQLPDYHLHWLGNYVDPASRALLRATTVAGKVPIKWPLLAWSRFDRPDDYALYTVPCFDFGEYCIGDYLLEKGNVAVNTHVGHQYARPFLGAGRKSWPEVVADIARYGVAQGQKVMNGLPIMPPYCFNKLRWRVYRLGAQPDDWPIGQMITVAVRLVAHIDMPKRTAEFSISLPHDLQLSVTLHATANVIRADIIRSLRRTNAANLGDDWDPDACLFGQDRAGKWQIELWILPQAPCEMKMFRYAATSDKYGQPLRDFLSRDAVDGKRDGRLYLEAHIFPQTDQHTLNGNQTVTGTTHTDEDEDEEEEEEEEEDEVPDQADPVAAHGNSNERARPPTQQKEREHGERHKSRSGNPGVRDASSRREVANHSTAPPLNMRPDNAHVISPPNGLTTKQRTVGEPPPFDDMADSNLAGYARGGNADDHVSDEQWADEVAVMHDSDDVSSGDGSGADDRSLGAATDDEEAGQSRRDVRAARNNHPSYTHAGRG